MNIKKTFYYIGILTIMFSFINCDNDDDSTPNKDTCNYQGFSFLNTNDQTKILKPESDLTTDFYNTASGGAEIEIYDNDNPGDFNFRTKVVTLNGTGTGKLQLNGKTYTVNVICQRTGGAIGEEMRYDLTASGIEVEFCVIIDKFH